MLVSTLSHSDISHPIPSLDPTTLCQYCDEPWPENPSAELSRMRAGYDKQTRIRPRSLNALGRQSSTNIAASLCDMHRNESIIIPAGLAEGWPATIDFEALTY